MEHFSKESEKIRRTFYLMAIDRGYNLIFYQMKNIELQNYGLIQISHEEELNLFGGRNVVEQTVYNVGYFAGFVLTIGLKAAEEIAKDLLLDKVKN